MKRSFFLGQILSTANELRFWAEKVFKIGVQLLFLFCFVFVYRLLLEYPYGTIPLTFSSSSKRKSPYRAQIKTSMATSDSSSAAPDHKIDIIKKMQSHEVALAELNNLPSYRPVYQKNGNIFFRTTIQKATASEQKQLDSTKAKLEKLNSH